MIVDIFAHNIIFFSLHLCGVLNSRNSKYFTNANLTSQFLCKECKYYPQGLPSLCVREVLTTLLVLLETFHNKLFAAQET